MRTVHAWVLGLAVSSACSGKEPPGPDDSGGGGVTAPSAAGMLGSAGGNAGAPGGGMVGGDAGSSGGSSAPTAPAGSPAPAGTGSAPPAGAGALPPGDGSFLPLVTGNTWTYRVTAGGVSSMKTQTIGELERVGGAGPNQDAMAYRATTTKDDGGDMTVSWQAELDGKVVRYREQAFMAMTGALELEEHWDPYKLRVDGAEAHLMAGATWTETYSETKLLAGMPPATATANDTWRVVAIHESVTVPAGTFDALVIEKTVGTPKRYWFVRGVGKVKETGTQTEELASYDVME